MDSAAIRTLPPTALTAERIAGSRWWVSFSCVCDGRAEVYVDDAGCPIACSGCVCECGAPAVASDVHTRCALCVECLAELGDLTAEEAGEGKPDCCLRAEAVDGDCWECLMRGEGWS